MEENSVIRPELENRQEERLENSLRPQSLDEYIGQTKVREQLKCGTHFSRTHFLAFRIFKRTAGHAKDTGNIKNQQKQQKREGNHLITAYFMDLQD